MQVRPQGPHSSTNSSDKSWKVLGGGKSNDSAHRSAQHVHTHFDIYEAKTVNQKNFVIVFEMWWYMSAFPIGRQFPHNAFGALSA